MLGLAASSFAFAFESQNATASICSYWVGLPFLCFGNLNANADNATAKPNASLDFQIESKFVTIKINT